MNADPSTLSYWPSIAGAVLVAVVHLCTPWFRFMRAPDNPWLPVSAGVATAYVFMDIFPHLAEAREKLEHVAATTFYGFLTHHIYLVSLLGFALYFGTLLLVEEFREGAHGSQTSLREAPFPVQIEVGSLHAYHFLIGYLITERLYSGTAPVVLFSVAMAIHVLGLDSLLRAHFPRLYDRRARYSFAASVVAGAVAGIAIDITDTTLALWFAMLAGGIIAVCTVLEIPHVRTKRQYGFFCAGAFGFALLFIAM